MNSNNCGMKKDNILIAIKRSKRKHILRRKLLKSPMFYLLKIKNERFTCISDVQLFIPGIISVLQL